VPREVQASFLLWLTAVGAGIVETVIRVIGSLGGGPDSSGLLLRGIVFTGAGFVIAQMRLGERGGRITLTIMLGGIGTLPPGIDPIPGLPAG